MSQPASDIEYEQTVGNAPTGRFILAAAVLSVTNFLGVFDGMVVTVALPHIERDLSMSQLSGQWVITGFSLPLGGLLLLGGRYGDRYGRRRVLVVGMCLFVAGLVLGGLAQNVWIMLPARAMQGAGAAMAIPNTYAMISSMRSTSRRQRTFAAVAVAGSSGAAGGAVIGGLVTQALGWRYVFYLTIPVAVAAIALTPKVLDPGRTRNPVPRVDALAALLSTGGLMMLVYSITNIELAGLTSPRTWATFLAAVIVLTSLLWYENNTWAPLLRPSLLRIRTLRAALLGMPGQVFAYQGSVYIGLLFFQQSMGYSPLKAGLAFAPLGLAALVMSPLANRMLKDHHWAWVAFGAQIVCALGLAVFASATPRDGYVTRVLPALLILGGGIAIAAVTLNLAAGNDVGTKEKGVAYGLFETSTHVSGAFVVAGLATVAAAGRAHLGHTASDAVADGYRLALAVAAVAALLAGVITAVVGRAPSDRARRPGAERGSAGQVR